MNVASVVFNTAVQLGVGVTSGALIDTVFPTLINSDHHVYTAGDVLFASTEVALQVTTNALLVAAMYKMMLGLSPSLQDPAGGFVFTLALIESQPNLKSKIGHIANFFASEVLQLTTSAHVYASNAGMTVKPHPNEPLPRGSTM